MAHIHIIAKPGLCVVIRGRVVDEFKEPEHPRKSDGEFAPLGGGQAGASNTEMTRAKTQDPVAKPKREPAPIKWTKAGGGDFTPHEVERLKSLSVPPAWTDIKLSEDLTASLQVVGKDSKGRGQYLYSAEHSEKAAAEKFARLKAFNGVAGLIMGQAQTDMFKGKTQRVRDSAAVLLLIGETGFRVGSENDHGSDVKAHGATTLTSDHVKVDGSDLSFDFIGKKGVKITKTVTHPELARFIGDKLKTAKPGEPLFDTNDTVVRKYMAAKGGDGFKVKDFRTWNGTCVALKTIAANPEPTTKAEFTKMRAHVAKVVSGHLGNTPTVALAAYIDSAVFLRWSHLQ